MAGSKQRDLCHKTGTKNAILSRATGERAHNRGLAGPQVCQSQERFRVLLTASSEPCLARARLEATGSLHPL